MENITFENNKDGAGLFIAHILKAFEESTVFIEASIICPVMFAVQWFTLSKPENGTIIWSDNPAIYSTVQKAVKSLIFMVSCKSNPIVVTNLKITSDRITISFMSGTLFNEVIIMKSYMIEGD